ncbi:MAG: riboflavin synthase [Legionella sp.]
MFTGLIEQMGEVISNEYGNAANRLCIRANFLDLQAGESIAVNGVCLTLLPDFTDRLAFDVSPETLRLTTLSLLKPGSPVNLERAMLAHSRFGGHYVSGHVDAQCLVDSSMMVGDYLEWQLTGFSNQQTHYLIPKGSITVDGVSLTINQVNNNLVKLMLVPHTLKHTTLGQRKVGDLVNIEFDYLTRIIAHQLEIISKVTDRPWANDDHC